MQLQIQYNTITLQSLQKKQARKRKTALETRMMRFEFWTKLSIATFMLSSWSSLSSRQDAVLFATALQFPGIPPPVPTASARAVVGSGDDGVLLFDRMKTIELTSVSTGRSEYLTDRWRNKELLPFRNQRCVIEFLRHFG